MKILTLAVIILFIDTIVVEACISGPISQQRPIQSVEPVSQVAEEVSGQKTWETRWNETLKKAKREGKVVMYSVANPQSRIALSKAFQEKFGIELEFITGSGAELPRRLQNERRAGLKLVNLYNSGFSILIQVKPTGALEPLAPHLILPEVLDEKVWLSGKLPYVDKDGLVMTMLAGASYYLLINTDMVNLDQIKSYMDLLKPEWKGKILMYDPSIGGGANEWISMMLLNVIGMEKGREFLMQFAKQEPVIIRDTRLSAEWVAKGKYPLVIGAYKQAVTEFQEVGAPIKYQRVAEGGLLTSSGGMIGRVEGGPSPNAATIFLNWLLSKEGQTIYARNYGFPSARVDVPTEGIDPTLVPLSGEKVIRVDEEWYLARDKLLPLIREIFKL